jgi:carbonic anhydrase
MFVVRNSANMIPHAENYGVSGYEVSITTEPAALELAVKRGGINHVIVCGHADCKAINTLYSLHCNPDSFNPNSPMDNWLRKHGFRSVSKLLELLDKEKSESNVKLEFSTDNPLLLKFSAYIDPDLGVEDKLSQINALQQICHIASHGFLQDYLLEKRVHLHVLWFDIYKGDMYMFSRSKERFILIDETTVDQLESEASGGYKQSL